MYIRQQEQLKLVRHPPSPPHPRLPAYRIHRLTLQQKELKAKLQKQRQHLDELDAHMFVPPPPSILLLLPLAGGLTRNTTATRCPKDKAARRTERVTDMYYDSLPDDVMDGLVSSRERDADIYLALKRRVHR